MDVWLGSKFFLFKIMLECTRSLLWLSLGYPEKGNAGPEVYAIYILIGIATLPSQRIVLIFSLTSNRLILGMRKVRYRVSVAYQIA